MSVRQIDPKLHSESLGMRKDLVVEHEPLERFVENESQMNCDILTLIQVHA
jgi:hypothetical protein